MLVDNWSSFCETYSILLDGALKDSQILTFGIKFIKDSPRDILFTISHKFTEKKAGIFRIDDEYNYNDISIDGRKISFIEIVEILQPYAESIKKISFFDVKSLYGTMYSIYCIDPYENDSGFYS